MSNTPRLIRAEVIIRRFRIKNGEGMGTFELPAEHLFGMGVPQGGSNCTKCRFVSQDKKSCGNEYFHKWRESLNEEDPSLLPMAADSYCCDVFSAKGKT